jgi:hypothetical protein
MPKSTCETCGGVYCWRWEEAFEKFGFADGNAQAMTHLVAGVLNRAGYETQTFQWGCHNTIITSIVANGVELIPATEDVGHDDPCAYLPKHLLALLRRKHGPTVEVEQ